MATVEFFDKNGDPAGEFDARKSFEFHGYRFGPRDWSEGIQCEPIEGAGFSIKYTPDPAPSPPPVPAAPTLAEVKTAARGRVNAWRAKIEESGFEYDGKRYQSDQRSAQRIQGALQMANEIERVAPGSFSQEWKAEDNTRTMLDRDGIAGMFAAMGTHIGTTFAQSEAYKAQINTAIDESAVAAILATLNA